MNRVADIRNDAIEVFVTLMLVMWWGKQLAPKISIVKGATA